MITACSADRQKVDNRYGNSLVMEVLNRDLCFHCKLACSYMEMETYIGGNKAEADASVR